MNFDFDNFNKYLQPEISPEAKEKIRALDLLINPSKLNEKELKFIDDVKRRIKCDKNVTEKQKIWLAKIIGKCQETDK